MVDRTTQSRDEADALQEALARAGRVEVETSSLGAGDLESLWAGVREGTVAARPGWRQRLQELPTGVRITVSLALALVVAALMVLVTGPRGAEIGTPLGQVVMALSVLALLAAASFAVSLRAIHRRPLRGWAWVVIGVALAVPFGLALIPPASYGVDVAASGCLLIGLMTGLLVSIPVFLMQRASVPVLARACAALAGGGVVAYAVLELHCPSRDLTHLLVSHAVIGVVLVVLSAVVVLARRP